MAEKARQRKMVNIDISETSGVDHPAHLQEGWMVRKSVDADTVNKLFGLPDADKEGATMPAQEENVKPEAEVTPDAEAKEAAEKAAAPGEATKDEVINALKAEIKELKKKSADSEEDGDNLIEKAAGLPDAVKDFMAKQKEDLAKAREEVAKERDARLDADAITKSREVFKSLGVNHEEVAPALRRLALTDADVAKSVETALNAAEAQLQEAGIFKEAGKSQAEGVGTDAMETLTKAAEKLIADGITKDRSVAMTKALEANPELYTQYLNESVGK